MTVLLNKINGFSKKFGKTEITGQGALFLENKTGTLH